MRSIIILLFSFMVVSCVVVPKKIEYYDHDCEIASKRYELTTEQYSLFEQAKACSDDECTAQAVGVAFGAIAVTSISAVISGSIVLVGNTVYWLEKQGKCSRV
ncbi:hypothetical protein [Shewanella sp.]|uniref:hypothetical protein n=1 Tax=Shewanella sp. TaxID=50422 RepID=UPI003568B817